MSIQLQTLAILREARQIGGDFAAGLVARALTEGFSEQDHPRDAHGRFVKGAALAAAAADPQKAASLRKTLDPANKKKLDAYLAKHGGKPVAAAGKPGASKVDLTPKPAAKNGRDQDASGLPARGTKAQHVGPWDATERAKAVGKVLRSNGIPVSGKVTKEQATAVERVFAEALNFDHWGENFPADIAGIVKFPDGTPRRVGIDLKTAITQKGGHIKRDDNAEALKIGFTQADFDKTASGGAKESVMFFLACNANYSVTEVGGKPAGLLYLEANVRGGSYKNMIPIQVEGLKTLNDLTKPEVLLKTREAILAEIRKTDMGQFKKTVTKAAEGNASRVVRQTSKILAIDAKAGANVKEKHLVELGKALDSTARAQKKARDLSKALKAQEAELAELRAFKAAQQKKAGLL